MLNIIYVVLTMHIYGIQVLFHISYYAKSSFYAGYLDIKFIIGTKLVLMLSMLNMPHIYKGAFFVLYIYAKYISLFICV